MNDVAEAAGVTKPVLYQHFRCKRELYKQVLTDVGDQLLDAITKATAAARSPHEQVELGFIAYFRFVEANEAAFRVLFGGGTRRDEEFAAQVAIVEGAIAEAIAALIDVEELTVEQRRQLAHGLVGLAEGASRLWMDEGAQEPAEEVARLMADLAWRGLRDDPRHLSVARPPTGVPRGRALLRTLPASSRSGSSTTSTVRGSL